jgi:hypothetical protein
MSSFCSSVAKTSFVAVNADVLGNQLFDSLKFTMFRINNDLLQEVRDIRFQHVLISLESHRSHIFLRAAHTSHIPSSSLLPNYRYR